MPKNYLLKKLFLPALICMAFNTFGQLHPLAFSGTNWYRNYVGLRFEVSTPAPLAGDKRYTAANDGSGGPLVWGGLVTTPLLNKPVIMPPSGDSLCGTAMPAGYMTGRIALVYRGGGIEFSDKALKAQNAGAIACVIVNNFSGPPVGMAIGSFGGSVTIPVFMISKADGDALDVDYNLGISETMTITPWSQGYKNDLGFVPSGAAGWHAYAIPYDQMFSSGNPVAYRGMDGAFIANYGSSNAVNVKVNDTLRYTPTGLSSTIIHTDVSATLPTFTGTAHLPVPDSIYAMLASSEYNFAPTGSGTGRFDLKYTITSDTADQFPADNTTTFSFYTTDSLYSKGQYDFVNNVPVSPIFEAPTSGNDFLWGPTYYVAHGGAAISSVQFSIASNTPGPIALASMNIYAFKWVDGSGGQPLDSLVQNGELTLVSLGVYSFLGTDTSGGVFKVQMGAPLTGIPGAPILLDSNAWYYIAAEVPATYFLGCDGQQSPFPRTYSRFHVSGGHIMDYAGILWFGDYNSGINPMTSNPFQGNPPNPYPNTTYVNSVDSFNYRGQVGLVPSVALIVDNSPNLIFGTATVCVSATTTLSDHKSGGTWSSSNTAVATVGSTGIVTGVSAGTATISYTALLVSATKTVTVAPLPVAGTVTGASSICGIGTSTNLSDATAGGVWSSSNTAVATVGTAGKVTSVAVGTSVISYTVTNSCASAVASKTITVNTTPVAGTITGTGSVCIGLTVTLSDATTGGVWSSSNTAVATAGTAGSVTGVSSGTSVISYTVTNPCGTATTTHTVSVSPAPVAGTITGPTGVCVGSAISLTDAAAGGAWSSTTTSVATVGTSGSVTGVSAGTSIISYTVTNGCGSVAATSTVTVSTPATAGSISGPSTICIGSPMPLSDGTPGGVWTSGSTTVATIGSSGTVTGVSAGTSVISYTVTNSCSSALATYTISIIPAAVAGTITGVASVCVSATISLTDAVAGGVWSSSNTAAATVAVGVVTGVSAGTTVISYTVINTCSSAWTTKLITVNPLPDAGAISGAVTSVCVGSTISLTDGIGAGAWTASNGNALVSGTGSVLGVTTGVDTIIYTVTNVCGSATATDIITVNGLPDAGTISGPDTVCISSIITLADVAAGGTWTASNGNAFVSSTGDVSGLSTGVDTIFYSVSNTCGTASAQYLVNIGDCIDGVKNISSATGDITVFPNPAKSDISINSSAPIYRVVINNLIGQAVYSGTYNSNSVTVGIGSLPNGVYILKINNDRFFKIVKE